ncbi:hypothetical protein HanIR_Chr13g0656941 [Helianthus annuus]|nr:hypothetical protein HanIR_Chr13g0656941 [Helianthus annuus]
MDHHGPVIEMACHASGGLLVTAGADAKILVCFFLDTMIHTCLLSGGRDQIILNHLFPQVHLLIIS